LSSAENTDLPATKTFDLASKRYWTSTPCPRQRYVGQELLESQRAHAHESALSMNSPETREKCTVTTACVTVNVEIVIKRKGIIISSY